MLRGIALLLAFQAVGELLSHQLKLPISGAVCGMALLLAWLIARGKAPDDVTRVTDALLANMPVLFVPVGVGAMVYADVFQRIGRPSPSACWPVPQLLWRPPQWSRATSQHGVTVQPGAR